MPPTEDNPLTSRLGLTEAPTKTSANFDNGNGGAGSDTNYLRLLEVVLLMPVLSLVKMYLANTNGTGKTIENCLLDFRRKHPRPFFIAFSIDFFFRVFYVLIVIIVTIRGLGIDQYLKTFCWKP